MITLEFLKEQLEAKAFLPFTVVTASGTRYKVKTRLRQGFVGQVGVSGCRRGSWDLKG